jgi:DNA adenine methylase
MRVSKEYLCGLPCAPVPHSALLPLIKWAGGKRWLLPYLLPLMAPYRGRRLVEPFAGSMALALAFRPQRALLCDRNPHVMNFYRWVQRGFTLSIPMENDRDLYYAHRERFNQLIREGREDSEEAALLFYYLNRTGYNGLCRFNRKGEFNVPFGKYRAIPYERDFTPYRQLFKHWEFLTGDFETLPLEEGDVLYLDPPYDVEFTAYTKETFGWEDQVRLAEWARCHRGPVILSNQATPRILALYESCGFTIYTLWAPRRISCNGDRAKALEVLALRGL